MTQSSKLKQLRTQGHKAVAHSTGDIYKLVPVERISNGIRTITNERVWLARPVRTMKGQPIYA